MNILVFAPHNDDEVLGVGGTICKLSKAGHNVYVCEVTSGPRYKQMQEEAAKAHQVMGVKESFFLNLPVSQLADYSKVEINAAIDNVVQTVKPDVVYMPFIWDMHFDHRIITEAVLVAIRPINGRLVKRAYMYETLSETGWNLSYGEHCFSPNCWVEISDTIEDKIEAMLCYQSQVKDSPHPRSVDGIRALAAYRGSTICVPFAESFMLVRDIQ